MVQKCVTVPSSALLRQDTGTPAELAHDRTEVLKLYNKFRLNRLEQILGYTFNDKSFLLQAVTHPSFIANKVRPCGNTRPLRQHTSLAATHIPCGNTHPMWQHTSHVATHIPCGNSHPVWKHSAHVGAGRGGPLPVAV